MTPSPVNPYDVVPYTSHPLPQSHPSRLATMAALCGMSAPAVATARVLELGAASGGNIIPLACDYPDATIVGVDASTVHIEAGSRRIEALGLRNIRLCHSDILTLDASLGQFDYIICHGVFSWVAPQVQDKILSIAVESLVPDGIAYISYNTYPGWHLRGVVRDLMQYHTSRDDDPKRRVADGRRVLDVVARLSAGHSITHYSALLQHEARVLGESADYYLFHEHLEERCEPFYFHEFIRRARGKGLDFLGEAHLTAMASARLTPAVHRELMSLAADTIEREQYLDFVCNRTFRETLLCRAGRTPNYELSSDVIRPLHIASRLRPPACFVDLAPGATTRFVAPSGESLSASLPLLKAALLELARHWPAAIPFEQLLAAAAARLGVPASNLQRILLAQAIISTITESDLIEVSVEPSRFTIVADERPAASRLARHQALQNGVVTNCRHERIELSCVQRRVLLGIDGSRDLAQVAHVTELSLDEVRRTVADLARLALIIH